MRCRLSGRPTKKLAAFEFPQENSSYVAYEVLANNAGYQSMTNLSKERVAANPGSFDPDSHHKNPIRFLMILSAHGLWA